MEVQGGGGRGPLLTPMCTDIFIILTANSPLSYATLHLAVLTTRNDSESIFWLRLSLACSK